MEVMALGCMVAVDCGTCKAGGLEVCDRPLQLDTVKVRFGWPYVVLSCSSTDRGKRCCGHGSNDDGLHCLLTSHMVLLPFTSIAVHLYS